MDDFTKLSLGVMSDIDQLDAGIANGDESSIHEARDLLKKLIDASDGAKLSFWLRAIGMLAQEAVKQARGD